MESMDIQRFFHDNKALPILFGSALLIYDFAS
jgi:hypothetical protein